MKELYILRHAKSDWNGYYVSDFDRGLNQRGEKDAPLMGQVLKKKKIMLDLMIASPAIRAKTTAEIVADKIGYDKEAILYDERIYEASTEQLLQVIKETDSRVQKLMLVGHNPGLTSLVHALCDADLGSLPTAGLVGIGCDIDKWRECALVMGTFLFFEYPKKYE